MKKLLLASCLVLAGLVPAKAADTKLAPIPKVELQEAMEFMNTYKPIQGLSEREQAAFIYENIWTLEKITSVCPAFVYINVDAARGRLFFFMQIWKYFYGVGKTATEIAQEVSQHYLEIYNNELSYSDWCKHIRDSALKHAPNTPVFTQKKQEGEPQKGRKRNKSCDPGVLEC